MKTAIQIGTSDGKDEFRQLCDESKFDMIYLVEPLLENNCLIKRRYEGMQYEISNIAITTDETLTHAKLYNMSRNGQHDSLVCRKSHHINEWVREIPYLVVPCMTLNAFLMAKTIQEIDTLCIDTEGLDAEIILSYDFNIASVRRLIWEKWDHENDDANGKYNTGPSMDQRVIRKLERLGYKISIGAFSSSDTSNWIATKE